MWLAQLANGRCPSVDAVAWSPGDGDHTVGHFSQRSVNSDLSLGPRRCWRERVPQPPCSRRVRVCACTYVRTCVWGGQVSARAGRPLVKCG